MALHEFVTNWSISVKSLIQLKLLGEEADFSPALEIIQALHDDLSDGAPVSKDTLQRLIDLIKEYDSDKSDGSELFKAVVEFEKSV